METKHLRVLMIVALIAVVGGCIGGSANSIVGDAEGGAGVNVDIYKAPGSIYIQASPGAMRQLRPEYRGIVATMCGTPLGSCPMSVPIQIGSSCFCPTYQGPVYGLAY